MYVFFTCRFLFAFLCALTPHSHLYQVVAAPNVPDAYNLYSGADREDEALPLVHFSRRIFWAAMATVRASHLSIVLAECV